MSPCTVVPRAVLCSALYKLNVLYRPCIRWWLRFAFLYCWKWVLSQDLFALNNQGKFLFFGAVRSDSFGLHSSMIVGGSFLDRQSGHGWIPTHVRAWVGFVLGAPRLALYCAHAAVLAWAWILLRDCTCRVGKVQSILSLTSGQETATWNKPKAK